MDTKDRVNRENFVSRLHEACDRSPLVPAQGAGRQSYIAERLNLSAEGVNKWFKARAIPRPVVMKKLAQLLNVDEAWLALGVTPEIDRNRRIIHGKSTDGAAQLVYALMTFAGIRCGQPSDTDPRREYVDFYAMIGTSVYPIRVTLGREISEGEYEFYIIPEFKDVRTIGVISLGQDRFHFLDLPADEVDMHKQDKSPSFRLVVNRDPSNSRYVTDKFPWPRIRTFAELE